MGISVIGTTPAAGGGGLPLVDEVIIFLLTDPEPNQLEVFFENDSLVVGLVTAIVGPHFSGMEVRPAALDAVAASETAMDAVIASEIALNAVIASEIALNAVIASATAMNAVAASAIAMNAVIASETAMNSVAASATARTAVLDSSLAMDAINASSIAIGKLSVGIAALDPVDFADMDAVAASETAMNAVIASEIALNAVVASATAMNAVAASETATNAITLQNLPFSFSNAQAVFNSSVGFIRINRLEQQDISNFVGLKTTINLTDKNTLRVPASASTLGQTTGRMRAIVRINGSEVLNLDGANTTLVNQDINISGFSGACSIEFGYLSTNFGGTDAYFVQFGPWLVF